MTRRESLSRIGATSALVSLTPLLRAFGEAGEAAPFIATNTYPWGTFAGREQKPFALHTDALLADIASTGLTGYEPIINSVAEFDGLAERLKQHGLEMRSLYVNSELHDEVKAEASIAGMLAIAERAQDVGTEIIVTNPSPILWGGPEDKDDAQLTIQAKALDRLGAELRRQGLTLAYHNHDAELRQGGREFHHMLTATDPENVKFCLDAHWIFRGCGNSQVALFDALEHYGSRVVELHLRQSVDGPWTEVFAAEGDIDYIRLAVWLQIRDLKPQITLEQAVEGGSPNSLNTVEAHRRSVANTRALFFGGV